MVGVLPRNLEHEIAKLDPTIIDLLPPRPLKLSLGDETTTDDRTEALQGMSNWKAVGP